MILLSTIYFLSLAMSRTWNQRVDPNRSKFKKQFLTAVKIFLIVGINWIFEIASFVAEWHSRDQLVNPLSYVSAFSNLLQGLLIFALLVLDKTVLKKLAQKLFKHKEEETRIERLNSLTPMEIASN
jgi:hypothetical protein